MKRTSFAIALTVVALTAACGGGDDSSAGDRRTDSTTESGASTDSTAGAGGASSDSVAAPGAPTGSGDDSLDPCSLVTSDEAAEVLGDKPDKPTDVQAGDVSACTYRLPDGSAAVQINMQRGDDATFESQVAELSGEAVDGVGDKALVNATVGQISVVKGDVLFAIFVSLGNGERPDSATLVELGKAAAGRA